MTKIKGFFKQQWRMILTVLTFLALAVVIYAMWDQIVETFRNLFNVNLFLVFLIIPLQMVNFHTYALLYQRLFSILGHKINYKFMLRTVLELNFVNMVFPSGGVSGFSYFGLRMRARDVSGSKATLVQTMRFIFLFVAFEVLIILGLVMLAFDGRVNNFMLLVSGSLATLMLIATLGLMFIVGSKKRINAFFTFITKAINRIIHFVRPNHPETINIERAKQAFTDYHENYKILKSDYRQLKWPFIHALTINITDILTVYVVFLAFSALVNPGAVIIAYAVANFAGLISVLPGGIGVYEAIMAAVLATGGVSPAVSLPVIIMYRVVNIVIQTPIGGALYHQTIQKAGKSG